MEGDEALQKGIGVSVDELQATFDKALDARFGSIRAALRELKDSKGSGEDVEALRKTVASSPGSYQAQLALGAALAEQGDRAAFEPLEKAAALVPVAIGERSPHAIMGRLAEKLGDGPRAIKEYRALLANDHTAVEPARRLAELSRKAGDEDALALATERVVALDPFDGQFHSSLGRLALKRREAPVAIREFRVALASNPADPAAAHCDLGEAYLLGAKPADAKREALDALEIAPSFERAQDLLLKAIDAGKGSGAAGRYQ